MAVFNAPTLGNQAHRRRLVRNSDPNQTRGTPIQKEGDIMGMGKGLLLWMLGIPLPIIILLAIFWR
jgi:hypothetical protein